MWSFELVESASTALWDFGWFDRSTFRIAGALTESAVDVLRQFLHAPVFPRSFCEAPDPWAAPIDRHGPVLLSHLSIGSYGHVSHDALQDEVRAVLEDPRFHERPSPAQHLPVTHWLGSVQSASSFLLRRDPRSEVDWNHVWLLFKEVVSIDVAIGTLTVAAFGYD